MRGTAASQTHGHCHSKDILSCTCTGRVTVDPMPCRFPGTKASYHALLDVADNELMAEAQARQAAMRKAEH